MTNLEQATALSRVSHLEFEQVQEIVRRPFEAFSGEEPSLPTGLSPYEVGDIGVHASNYAERVLPSEVGYRNGLQCERRTVRSIGLAAIYNGDTETAESSIYHLRHVSAGIKGRLDAFVLKRVLRYEASRS